MSKNLTQAEMCENAKAWGWNPPLSHPYSTAFTWKYHNDCKATIHQNMRCGDILKGVAKFYATTGSYNYRYFAGKIVAIRRQSGNGRYVKIKESPSKKAVWIDLDCEQTHCRLEYGRFGYNHRADKKA